MREGERQGLEGREEESESGGSGRTRLYYTNGPRDSRPASDDVVLTTRTFSRTYSRTYSFSFLAYMCTSVLRPRWKDLRALRGGGNRRDR